MAFPSKIKTTISVASILKLSCYICIIVFGCFNFKYHGGSHLNLDYHFSLDFASLFEAGSSVAKGVLTF